MRATGKNQVTWLQLREHLLREERDKKREEKREETPTSSDEEPQEPTLKDDIKELKAMLTESKLGERKLWQKKRGNKFEGTCWNCGKKGHRKFECKQPVEKEEQ